MTDALQKLKHETGTQMHSLRHTLETFAAENGAGPASISQINAISQVMETLFTYTHYLHDYVNDIEKEKPENKHKLNGKFSDEPRTNL